MPETYSQLLLHVVTSTKGHTPWIKAAVAEHLHPHFGGIVRVEKGVVQEVQHDLQDPDLPPKKPVSSRPQLVRLIPTPSWPVMTEDNKALKRSNVRWFSIRDQVFSVSWLTNKSGSTADTGHPLHSARSSDTCFNGLQPIASIQPVGDCWPCSASHV